MKKSIKAVYMPQLEKLDLNLVADAMEGVALMFTKTVALNFSQKFQEKANTTTLNLTA